MKKVETPKNNIIGVVIMYNPASGRLHMNKYTNATMGFNHQAWHSIKDTWKTKKYGDLCWAVPYVSGELDKNILGRFFDEFCKDYKMKKDRFNYLIEELYDTIPDLQFEDI